MTAAIVLKPDFTTTFSRGVLRLAGTFAGLGPRDGLFAMLSPSHAVQILLIASFMFLMRWAGGVNYGILVIALTGLVVLLFAVTGVPPPEVALARAINTVIGGLIALAANRLWPTWERTRINEAFATLLDSYRDYFQAVRDGFLQPGIERDPAYAARLDRVRQAGRVARSNLEASFERFRIEPGDAPAAVAAMLGLLANSHRFIHAVMALEAGLYLRSRPAARRIRGFRKCGGYHALFPGGVHAPVSRKPRRFSRSPRGPSRARSRCRSPHRPARPGEYGDRSCDQQPQHPGRKLGCIPRPESKCSRAYTGTFG